MELFTKIAILKRTGGARGCEYCKGGVSITQMEVPVPPTQLAPLAPPKSQLIKILTGV